MIVNYYDKNQITMIRKRSLRDQDYFVGDGEAS